MYKPGIKGLLYVLYKNKGFKQKVYTKFFSKSINRLIYTHINSKIKLNTFKRGTAYGRKT